MIDDAQVQSKFINGARSSLDHVMDHMKKHETFGRDGSYYHIPKDQYSVIQKIAEGEQVEGFTSRSLVAIKNKLQAIETERGKRFAEVVKPSLSKYDEVQKGVVFKTVIPRKVMVI